MEHTLPRRTAGAPRTWSLCMTSENHGTVGPAGCKFTHAPDKHERVLVVEVPTAAGAPVDQVSLQLVTRAGGQADVDRALRAAQTWANEEYMCGRRMGKGELAMSDRAEAAKSECIAAILALAAPAAAQAGQVAVPDEQLEWSHDLQERLIAAGQDFDEHESVRQVMAEAACLLAALTGVTAPTSGER